MSGGQRWPDEWNHRNEFHGRRVAEATDGKKAAKQLWTQLNFMTAKPCHSGKGLVQQIPVGQAFNL